jgi:[lysine-biosynthesis-protein LysW]--L-2-aminoadipate ligase
LVSLGVIYDFIRPEEKMLINEARNQGVEVKLVDAKNIYFNISNSLKNLEDIYLQRCVSYFRSIHITYLLESFKCTVINSFNTALVCGNKLFTTISLLKNGVPVPKTAISFSKSSALKVLDEIGYPSILKPVIGSWGRLIAPLNDPESSLAILESREYLHPIYHLYYIQERVERPPRDIRSLVVDGQFICAIYRYQPPLDWRTNTARGGRAEPCPGVDELIDVSVRAAEAVNGEIVGVDCMESRDGLVVHEVNNTVEFKNMVRVTGVNIPSAIISYLKRRVRK